MNMHIKFQEETDPAIQKAIQLLIKRFNFMELQVSGMKSACESAKSIERVHEEMFEITKLLKPFSKIVTFHFPHLVDQFNAISKQFDPEDKTWNQ